MSLATYIAITIALSWVGFGAYQLFRLLGPSLYLRRIMLWLVVGLSLGMPLFHPAFRLNIPVLQPHMAPVIAQAPATVEEFCSCQAPDTHDIILFHASQMYDVILGSRGWMELILLIGGIAFAFIWLRTIVKMTRWTLFARRFAASEILDGKEYQLVRGWKGSQAGSLRWFGKYIFWNDSMDQLSETDRKAVLRHEWSHIAQANTWEKVVLGAIKMVWFLNPIHYLLHRELEALSEFTADQYAATENRKAYATLLLRVHTAQHALPIQLLGGHPLKKRIKMLLEPPKSHRRRMLASVVGIALLFSGELFADSVIRREMEDFAVYELLNQTNHQTGKTEFCRKCTYETVEQQMCY